MKRSWVEWGELAVTGLAVAVMIPGCVIAWTLYGVWQLLADRVERGRSR